MGAPSDARSKVVVRKLPPGIAEVEVRAAIDAVSQGKHDWFSFVPGKVSVKRIKHSRVYLNFPDPSDVYKFRAQFSGHAFVNKKGAQYKCTVEYAPYQKVPRDKAKEDSREGTCEKDADFIAFKQQMEGEPEMLPSAEAQLDAKEQEKKAALVEGTSATSQPRISSLMQFLHEKHSLKAEKKAPVLVPIKKKPTKPLVQPLPIPNAPADLPPHMINKPAPVPVTASKPPRAQPSALPAKMARADSGPGNPPGYSQQTPATKGRKMPQDQQAHPGNAVHTPAGASAASSRSATPPGNPRQQDNRAASPAAEPTRSPSVPRKVVPIPLDRLSRRDSPKPDSRSGSSQAAQLPQPSASSDNQASAKPGRKVRPGFQTWTSRREVRNRAEGLHSDEAVPDSALDAAKAAAAAALGSAQRRTGTATGGRSDTWGPSQAPGSGWDDDAVPAHFTEPSQAHGAGRGSSESGRGRSNSNRGRGPVAMRPVAIRPELVRSMPAAAAIRHQDSDSGMPGATWDDDVAGTPAQGAPMRQLDGRGRGQGRGRGRGQGRGSDAARPDLPPGGFGNLPMQQSSTGSVAAVPPRTVLIKQRPHPADAYNTG